MNWAIGLLSIGAVLLGTSLDRRRQRARQRLPRPEIDRWEEEGGAVPVSGSRTAAQTSYAIASGVAWANAHASTLLFTIDRLPDSTASSPFIS
jgi:hypothetical protein